METEAFFLVKYGAADQAFELRKTTLDPLRENEVCIEVASFGLNYADVMARNKLYREAPPLPAVIGYEVVGTIIAHGSQVSADYLGKKVLAFTRFGGYSKHIHSNLENCVLLDDISNNQALSLATQYVTAYYMAVYLSPVQAGERVLIHAAAGGVGTALIQLCKWRKAEVFAKVSSPSKMDYVKQLGADQAINYTQSDYAQQVENLLGDERLDVSFNPVAGSTFKKDFALLGSGGRLILFGGSERSGKKWGIFSSLNFVRKMGFVIPIGLMMRSKNVLGVNMLKIADHKTSVMTTCLNEVMNLYKQGILVPPQGEEFSAENLAQAHAKLESGSSIGKISVNW